MQRSTNDPDLGGLLSKETTKEGMRSIHEIKTSVDTMKTRQSHYGSFPESLLEVKEIN